MGEIRIVSPGETRGYPYPVCKKEFSNIAKNRTNSVSQVRKGHVSYDKWGIVGLVSNKK